MGLYGKKVVMVQIFGSSATRSIDSAKVRNALIRLYNDYKVHSLIMTHSTDKSTDITWTDIPGSVIAKERDCREIAAIMINCDLLLCPESALHQIGGALGVPCFSLLAQDPRARINYYSAVYLGRREIRVVPHW
jgi:ADP-heptose:LPS heptosyltransferase